MALMCFKLNGGRKIVVQQSWRLFSELSVQKTDSRVHFHNELNKHFSALKDRFALCRQVFHFQKWLVRVVCRKMWICWLLQLNREIAKWDKLNNLLRFYCIPICQIGMWTTRWKGKTVRHLQVVKAAQNHSFDCHRFCKSDK